MTLLDVDSLHLVESSVKNKGSEDGVRTWSTAVQILLPVAALAILWGRRGFIARFFLQFDKNCVSVLCPSFSKRQRLLKWASGRLPPNWSSQTNTIPGGPTDFWRDGSLLCTIINSAIPGACPNPHRHWRRSPSHGQALAYKYLGVAPIFNETEFIKTALSLKHERALLLYLVEVQEAITKISEHNINRFSSRYVARGMGLVVGEQHKKATFYVYSSSTTSSSKHDVLVSIKGPYNNHGSVTVPARYAANPYRNYSFPNRKHLGFPTKTQKLFYKPISIDLNHQLDNIDVEGDIPIQLTADEERVRVTFIPRSSGIHEISMVTNGFHLLGSPFSVSVAENTTGITETFDERKPVRRNRVRSLRRKVVSRIIDFVDQKINFENLKTLPLYVKRIPEIKVTHDETVLDGEDSMTDQPINEEADLPDVQPQHLIIALNANSSEDQSLTSDAEANDNNNNTILMTTYDTKQEPHRSSTSVTTSPVCFDHTEQEVNYDDVNESSEVPKPNLRKKSLRRQENVDIPDFDTTKPKERLPIENPISYQSLKNQWEKTCVAHQNQIGNLTKNQNTQNLQTKTSESISKSKSLNILNFLDSLKTEDSPTLAQSTNQLHTSKSPDSNDQNLEFKKRLSYWESQTNDKPNKPKFRRSLPNLFPQAPLKLPTPAFHPDDQPSFKECQAFWSSQTISCSSLTSSLLHLEKTAKYVNRSDYTYRTRRSLPNLFSKNSRNDTLSEIVYRDSTFPVDFFKTPEGLDFKSRFKECKAFWERIGSQNLDSSDKFSECSRNGSPRHGHCDDNTFDSGFYNSLPNIWARSQSEEPEDCLKFKLQYEERRGYWEELSNASVSSLFLVEKHIMDTEAPFCTNKTTAVDELKSSLDKSKKDVTHNDLYDLTQHKPKHKDGTNLTDDLKRINDQKEKIKTQFCEARNFFRGLEDSV